MTTTDTLLPRDEEFINFGELPAAVNDLLQRGVVEYRRDRQAADVLFREALAAAPQQLPIYYCLYKIHTYQGNLREALAIAQGGLREAARQSGWSDDYRQWQRPPALDGPARFALYTLKALAFIHLRQNDRVRAAEKLEMLAYLDPAGMVGWPVVAALADGIG